MRDRESRNGNLREQGAISFACLGHYNRRGNSLGNARLVFCRLLADAACEVSLWGHPGPGGPGRYWSFSPGEILQAFSPREQGWPENTGSRAPFRLNNREWLRFRTVTKNTYQEIQVSL